VLCIYAHHACALEALLTYEMSFQDLDASPVYDAKQTLHLFAEFVQEYVSKSSKKLEIPPHIQLDKWLKV
jgi:hypothetical protein